MTHEATADALVIRNDAGQTVCYLTPAQLITAIRKMQSLQAERHEPLAS